MNNKYIQQFLTYINEINFIFLLVSVCMFFVSSFQNSAIFLLWSCVILWIHNIVFSIRDIKTRFLFLMFHLMFFLFVLGRPLFTIFKGWDLVVVQIEYGANFEGIILSFKIIYCVLLFILIGNRIVPCYKMYKIKQNSPIQRKKILTSIIYLLEDNDNNCSKNDRRIEKNNSMKTKDFRFAILFVLIVSFFASLILGVEKLVYIFNNSYTESYINFQSKMPYVIYIISSFFDYTVYFYLATFPDKKHSIICMLIYIISEVPSFLGGERNPICLAILFCIVYVIVRHFKDDNNVWINKRIKIVGFVGLVLGMIIMGIVNYYREGTSLGSIDPFLIIEDLIYKQGVTFSWICVALSNITLLRSQSVISYTFGGLIDYVCHNKVAQLFFGAIPLTNTNSIQMAKLSNDMSHHLSYLALGEEYLKGHGTGTSFLIEVFADFGWIGIVLFCVLLGLLFFYSWKLCSSSYKTRVFLFCLINGILFMPRGTTLECISFLWRISFWCCLFLCFIIFLIIKIIKRKRRK